MQGMRDGCDTPSQLHPGYVQGTKPHLPTPKDATGIRAKPSETFKVLFLFPQNTYLNYVTTLICYIISLR